MSTYCGKDCESCSYKEELNCAGCKQGPGRVIDGDCKLARCCRDKGHENCETCMDRRNCGMWLDKGTMARQRKESLEEETKKKEENIVTAQALAKWVKILFWMVVPIELFTLLGHERVTEIFPILEFPASVASGVMQLVCAWVLLQMSKIDEVYRKPAIFLGLAALLGVISGLIPDTNGWGLLFSIPTLVISLMASYHEFMAHAEVVAPFDVELSEKWNKIWKWYLFGMIGIFAGVFLTFILGILGALFMLACVVLLGVATILKYVYLYRMMKLFQAY